jgi:hypothetical protein
MATLDAEDLAAIQTMLDGKDAAIEKIQRFVRILNSNYISCGEWCSPDWIGATPPPDVISDVAFTGGGAGIVRLRGYNPDDDSDWEIGEIDLGTLIFSRYEGMTSIPTVAFLVAYIYNNASPTTTNAGRLSFNVNIVSSGGVSVPYTVAFDIPATTGDGVTMLPQKDGSVQRLFRGATIANRLGAFVTIEQIRAALTGLIITVGAGGQVIIPPFAGTITATYALEAQTLVIVRGDSFRLTFNFGADSSGWTPFFGMRVKDTGHYLITEKEATWISQGVGTGYVDVTCAENDYVGELEGEIELRNGAERHTALKVKIRVIDDVVK